jgi:Putative Actinobacterial Holin-X, holin superfamily III
MGENRQRTDQPIGELLQQASQQTATLVRQEIRLAQHELKEKGRHAGLGVGLLAGGGVVALLGLGALVTAAIAALSLDLPVWAAYPVNRARLLRESAYARRLPGAVGTTGR